MKTFLMLLIGILICGTAVAQKKWKYKIKVVEHSGKRFRGFFYKAEDTQLTLIKSSGDTIRLKAENIDKLFIHQRGIVAPLAVAGAVLAFIMAVENPNALESAVLIIAGIPLGVAVGLFTGELFANKRYYKQLEANDFPLIKDDLQKYTQIK